MNGSIPLSFFLLSIAERRKNRAAIPIRALLILKSDGHTQASAAPLSTSILSFSRKGVPI